MGTSSRAGWFAISVVACAVVSFSRGGRAEGSDTTEVRERCATRLSAALLAAYRWIIGSREEARILAGVSPHVLASAAFAPADVDTLLADLAARTVTPEYGGTRPIHCLGTPGFREFGRSIFIGSTLGGVVGGVGYYFFKPSPKTNFFLMSAAAWGALSGSFMGGGASKEKVTAAFKIILADPAVKGILVNIFGGIASCKLRQQRDKLRANLGLPSRATARTGCRACAWCPAG